MVVLDYLINDDDLMVIHCPRISLSLSKTAWRCASKPSTVAKVATVSPIRSRPALLISCAVMNLTKVSMLTPLYIFAYPIVNNKP